METLEQVKEQIKQRISAKRFDAQSYFNDADRLTARAKETMAEAIGLETALDYLKEIK